MKSIKLRSKTIYMRIGSLNKFIFIYIAYIFEILADSPPPGSV